MWMYFELATHPTERYLAWICLPVFLVLFSAGFVYLVAPQAIGNFYFLLTYDSFAKSKLFCLIYFRFRNSRDENDSARCRSQRIFDIPHWSGENCSFNCRAR